MAPRPRAPLPLLPLVRRAAGDPGPGIPSAVKRGLRGQLGRDGMAAFLDPLADRAVPLAFACTRSGHCCTGRQMDVSNLTLPSEVAAAYAALQADGTVTHIDDLREYFARAFFVHDPTRQRGPRVEDMPANHRAYAPAGRFAGLAFRMRPSDNPYLDGDRCVFLAGEHPGSFACRFHRQAAQPMPCALAPVGPVTVLQCPADPSVPLVAMPETRQRWCAGVQEVLAGRRPWITLGALLDANDGLRRLRENLVVTRATEATATWRNGFRDHHSPLARLYVAALPALAPWLSGC